MPNIKLLEGSPYKNIKEEIQLFSKYRVTHICTKNSGGEWSKAKIGAARELGLPIWFLRRPLTEKGYRYYRLFHSIHEIKIAIEQLII